MIIIKNGALVTPRGLRRADLAMEGDKIVRIAAAIEPGEGDTVEDAVGCWVFPGFIDGHTHMQCWTGMDWTAESFVCMEPWNGWANSVNEDGKHEVLEPDEAMTSEWSITIEKV